MIDVLRLAAAEERLQERVAQDAGVEVVLEAVERLLAAGVLEEGRHRRDPTAGPGGNGPDRGHSLDSGSDPGGR